MNKIGLLGTTAIAFVLGGIVMSNHPALAQLATFDASALAQSIKSFAQETGILSALQAAQNIQTTINSTISSINTAIGGTTFGDTNTLLREGFTQNANYSKAQVGAQQQITDASNTAMARFHRDVRNAQIQDEQTANPAHCAAVDGGVSTQSAAVQAFTVGQTIAAVHDQRGEASQGMPSYFGQGQGYASMARAHANNYCNADDAAAVQCTISAIPDADQKASNYFSSGAYADQTGVNTAKDYAVNLIEPVAPAALRGDQLASINGQEAAVRRRSYNARMSLAQTFVDTTIGMQVPSIPLTTAQTTYLQNMGLTVPASGNSSWMQVLQIESERRVSDVSWHTALQTMTPAGVQREVALELAMTNYLLFQNFKLSLQHATISATQLASDTDRNFMPTTQMPTPSMAASANGGT